MKFIPIWIFLLISGSLVSFSLFAAEYKVAVRAHHGVKDSFRQWQPTIDVLNKEIPEHTFIIIPIIRLNEISQRVGNGEFDFILTNPSSFVEINELYGVKALLTLNNKRANKAQDRFGGVIFTRIDNKDILSIRDLKDKTLMAVSEEAFGGWRVAWLEMLEQGFNPYTELKTLMFAKNGTQPEVVRAVRDGKVNVGIVRTDRLERMEDDGEIDMRYFRIINNKDIKDFPFFLSTALYPEWVFAARKSTSTKLIIKVKTVLLALHPVSAAAKAGIYMGWSEPSNYGSVRNLMQRLKVGPYASKHGLK